MEIIEYNGKKYKVVEILEEYKTITYKGKEFRIYKWTDKPFNEFKIPKGFKLCKHSQFIELFDNKLINYPSKGWEIYFLEHYSKRKKEEGYLLRCYLDRDSELGSISSDLSGSSDVGRVVVVK